MNEEEKIDEVSTDSTCADLSVLACDSLVGIIVTIVSIALFSIIMSTIPKEKIVKTMMKSKLRGSLFLLYVIVSRILLIGLTFYCLSLVCRHINM